MFDNSNKYSGWYKSYVEALNDKCRHNLDEFIPSYNDGSRFSVCTILYLLYLNNN